MLKTPPVSPDAIQFEGESISPCESMRASFHHQPLDHAKKSIRLLRISKHLSRDGLLQCSLEHTTIEYASYTCLSYRWGESTPSHEILINGCTSSIGKNLFDFVNMFRTQPENIGYIWIDALCIAQEDVKERNHQVTQMGAIFSAAQLVYVWLGKRQGFDSSVRDSEGSRGATTAQLLSSQNDGMILYICDNAYWTRAWITQELILAREIVIFMDEESMPFPELVSKLKAYTRLLSRFPRYGAFAQYARIAHLRLLGRSPMHSSSGQDTPAIDESEDLVGKGLLTLVNHFRDKECGLPQDRIFSLLSICSPSSRIGVNYDLERFEVLRELLAKSSPSLCFCDILVGLRSLDLYGTSWAGHNSSWYRGQRSPNNVYVEINLQEARLHCQSYTFYGAFPPSHNECAAFLNCLATLGRRALGSSPDYLDFKGSVVVKPRDWQNWCSSFGKDAIRMSPASDVVPTQEMRISMHFIACLYEDPPEVELCNHALRGLSLVSGTDIVSAAPADYSKTARTYAWHSGHQYRRDWRWILR